MHSENIVTHDNGSNFCNSVILTCDERLNCFQLGCLKRIPPSPSWLKDMYFFPPFSHYFVFLFSFLGMTTLSPNPFIASVLLNQDCFHNSSENKDLPSNCKNHSIDWPISHPILVCFSPWSLLGMKFNFDLGLNQCLFLWECLSVLFILGGVLYKVNSDWSIKLKASLVGG